MAATATVPRYTEILDAVRDLEPTITRRAAEIEQAIRLPADLLHDLKQAGRPLPDGAPLKPRRRGQSRSRTRCGSDQGSQSRRCVRGLDGHDSGSAAWTDLARGLPRATFDALYADGPDVIIGGAFAPGGTAEPVDGGDPARAGAGGSPAGREHSSWLMGQLLRAGRKRAPTADGRPRSGRDSDRGHMDRVRLQRGTGSHHFRADSVFVPAERTFATLEAEPCLDVLVVPASGCRRYQRWRSPVRRCGCGEGALADILNLATGKVPLPASGQLPPTRCSSTKAGHRRHLSCGLAHRLLDDEADSAWAKAVTGSPLTLEQRERFPFRGGVGHRPGGSGCRLRLPRRWQKLALRRQPASTPDARHPRDNPALRGQAGHPDDRAGAVLAGQEITVPVF